MNENWIAQLCMDCLSENPAVIKRCAMGIGNYVYYIECTSKKYIIRCSAEPCAYKNTILWLKKLSELSIPVPKVIHFGSFDSHEYMILSYLEGDDIGLVYTHLTDIQKQNIAKEVVRIQRQVALLKLEDVAPDWTWHSFIQDMLNRAEERIVKNGYFDPEKVNRLRTQAAVLDEYFSAVKPTAYLDDLSSKNLIIHNGQISGIIDVDWIGIGDNLTYVALTNVALLNLEYDTAYVSYILEQMQLDRFQQKAFLFYSLMYCVDFMGERGMQFGDKTVEVNQQIIDRLNGIYSRLWNEWIAM